MKNKFDKQFKNEFEHNFEPNIDINLLKQNLNIQPKNTNTLVLKKKVFFSYSIILSLLLIVVTALTTWSVFKWYSLSDEQPIEETENTDLIKMFQEKYVNSSIQLVGQFRTNNNIEFSIMFVKNTKDDEKLCKYIIYFNVVPTDILNDSTYSIIINNHEFTGKVLSNNNYIEYDIENFRNYTITFDLYYFKNKIFEFCTKI